jgi:hypothetical protein
MLHTLRHRGGRRKNHTRNDRTDLAKHRNALLKEYHARKNMVHKKGKKRTRGKIARVVDKRNTRKIGGADESESIRVGDVVKYNKSDGKSYTVISIESSGLQLFCCNDNIVVDNASQSDISIDTDYKKKYFDNEQMKLLEDKTPTGTKDAAADNALIQWNQKVAEALGLSASMVNAAGTVSAIWMTDGVLMATFSIGAVNPMTIPLLVGLSVIVINMSVRLRKVNELVNTTLLVYGLVEQMEKSMRLAIRYNNELPTQESLGLFFPKLKQVLEIIIRNYTLFGTQDAYLGKVSNDDIEPQQVVVKTLQDSFNDHYNNKKDIIEKMTSLVLFSNERKAYERIDLTLKENPQYIVVDDKILLGDRQVYPSSTSNENDKEQTEAENNFQTFIGDDFNHMDHYLIFHKYLDLDTKLRKANTKLGDIKHFATSNHIKDQTGYNKLKAILRNAPTHIQKQIHSFRISDDKLDGISNFFSEATKKFHSTSNGGGKSEDGASGLASGASRVASGLASGASRVASGLASGASRVATGTTNTVLKTGRNFNVSSIKSAVKRNIPYSDLLGKIYKAFFVNEAYFDLIREYIILVNLYTIFHSKITSRLIDEMYTAKTFIKNVLINEVVKDENKRKYLKTIYENIEKARHARSLRVRYPTSSEFAEAKIQPIKLKNGLVRQNSKEETHKGVVARLVERRNNGDDASSVNTDVTVEL